MTIQSSETNTTLPSQTSIPETPVNRSSSVVKYVVVVGFNHKKGAQIEYTYPETDKDSLLENFPHLQHRCLIYIHNFWINFLFLNLRDL